MDKPLGIVLAAGKGTRMNSELPKVLCQASGKPLVRYVLEALRAAGVERIICVVGYREELVRAELADDPHVEFATQAEQLGTGHAVMMCRELIGDHDGPVCVVAGDSPMLQAASVRQLLADFEKHRPGCLLGTLNHPEPTGLGRIVRDSDGKFLRIVEEKDASEEEKQISEVNMSTYVFDGQPLLRSLGELKADNRQKEYYITDVPEILLQGGTDVRALPVLQPIEALSVNTPEQLLEVERALRAD